jgi:hypothetical protein
MTDEEFRGKCVECDETFNTEEVSGFWLTTGESWEPRKETWDLTNRDRLAWSTTARPGPDAKGETRRGRNLLRQRLVDVNQREWDTSQGGTNDSCQEDIHAELTRSARTPVGPCFLPSN